MISPSSYAQVASQPNAEPHDGWVQSFDGSRIAYRTMGEGATTLILIHGWLCDQTHWNRVSSDLSHRYRVVTLDLAGHGRSERRRSDYTVESFARDVEAVVGKTRSGSLVLVGHSVGGLVALAAAARLRPHVQLVVGVDAFDGLIFITPSDTEIEASEAGLRADFRGYIYGVVRNKMFTAHSDPKLAEAIALAMSHADEHVAISARRAVMRTDGAELLEGAAGVPLLAIDTEDAAAYSDQWPQRAQSQLRQVRVPGTGHFIMLEKPSEFVAVLLSAIDRLQ
jgi:pimeloyl-ACP methyl ester carboxylesterase